MPPPDDSGAYSRGGSFYDVLTRAINDMMATGYISAEQVAAWVTRIKEAALRSLTPPHILQEHLNATMKAIFRNKVERGGILKFHPGLPRFKLEQIAPRLRAEVDRRIMASAGLIKLNREKMVNDTVQRLAGWMTSVPPGGTEVAMRRRVKEEVRKPLASLPFLERRVVVDQSHKLVSNLNNIIATDCGAIALIWHSHWRQANYNYRIDHKERDGKVYMIRDNWAQSKGLVRVGEAGYYDQITAVGEEIYCRCYAQYLYSLRGVPADMLTVKGREAVEVRLAA
jgi:hypothetical protein